MNVGYPIDVNRIMSDNQRYQRDLSYSQHQQQQLRAKLDKTIAANNQLREECIRLERQKQEQLDTFIANHRQIYQAQLKSITQSNQALITQTQKQAKLQSLELISLKEQFNLYKDKAESELLDLRKIKQQGEKSRQLMMRQLKNKQDKLSLMESGSTKLQAQVDKLKQQLEYAKHQEKQLQQSFSELSQRYTSITNTTPQGILQQLFKLRKENAQILQNQEHNQLQAITNDQGIYNLIQKLHQELALLRYQLAETKNIKAEDDLFYLQQKEIFNNEKAHLQLNVISLEKEVASLRNERQKFRKDMGQLQLKQGTLELERQRRMKLQQQVALLQIKIFILQSLKDMPRTTKRQHKQKVEYHFESNSQAKNDTNYFASMQLLMSQTIDKLNKEQSMRRQLAKKVKEYKQKCESHSKTESELAKMIEQSIAKEQQYRRLIDKIQKELERSYQINSNILHAREDQNTSVPSKQPKDHHQIAFLKDQITRSHQSLQLQKNNNLREQQKLKRQISQLELAINQLKDQNHKLQAKVLEQTLNIPVKANKNYQTELADKISALISAEQELQKLRQQIENQKVLVKQKTVRVTQLSSKVDSLTRLLQQQSKSRQEQISQLKQKNAYLEGMLGQKRNSDGNRILTLCEQIVHLKTQSNDFKQDTIDRSDRAEREVQSYRTRLVELQQALNVINSENEQKSLQIFRLNKQNNVLSKQLDRLEQQLDALRGNSGSMRQFQLLDRNKQLEDNTQTTKKQLAQALQTLHLKQAQLLALKNQSDEAWKNNLELVLKVNQCTAQINHIKTKGQKIQRDFLIKQQQLQNRIASLQQENGLLKRQVEDLRSTLLQHQNKKIQKDNDQSERSQMQLELQAKNRQINNLQSQLDRLIQQRSKEKQIFDQQWNQLFSQLKQVKQQLHFHLNKHQQSRIQIITPQQNPNSSETNNYLAKISELQNELHDKNEKISYLEIEMRQRQLSINSRDIYTNQLFQARKQNQMLLQTKFKLEHRLRVLQQENSLLKIRKITQQPINNEFFSQQTFGPSLGSSELIGQLKQADRQPIQYGNDNFRQKYEQTLCLLVISWAEIESLRVLIAQIQEKSNHHYLEYTNKLMAIENNVDSSQKETFNFQLIKELECAHRHIVEIAQRRFNEGKEGGLAQMGTLAESITGGKMIQSFSVQEEEQSPSSQEYLAI